MRQHDRSRARGQRLIQLTDIDRHLGQLDIHKDRCGACLDDRVDRGREIDRRGNHLVARLQLKRLYCQQVSRRARIAQCYMAYTQVIPDRRLEFGAPRAGGVPIAIHYLAQIGVFWLSPNPAMNWDLHFPRNSLKVSSTFLLIISRKSVFDSFSLIVRLI